MYLHSNSCIYIVLVQIHWRQYSGIKTIHIWSKIKTMKLIAESFIRTTERDQCSNCMLQLHMLLLYSCQNIHQKMFGGLSNVLCCSCFCNWPINVCISSTLAFTINFSFLQYKICYYIARFYPTTLTSEENLLLLNSHNHIKESEYGMWLLFKQMNNYMWKTKWKSNCWI